MGKNKFNFFILVFAFMFFLSFSLVIAEQVSEGEHEGFFDPLNLMGDAQGIGTNTFLSNNNKTLTFEKDSKIKYNITSSISKMIYDDKKRKWDYIVPTNETIKSKDKLIIKGQYFCRENDYTINGKGLGENKIYKDCVYYPPYFINQSVYITHDENDKKLDKPYWGNKSVNVIKLSLINDYEGLVEIPVNNYDPLVSDFTEGIVSCWNFDSNANDSIGINNGTPIGGVTYSSGKVGNAINLDSSNDYVLAMDDNSLDIANTITIATWIYITDNSSDNDIIGKGGHANTQNYKLWIWSGNGNLYFDAPQSAIRLNGVPAGGFQEDKWYFVAVTYDKDAGTNNLKIFVDGTIIAQESDAAAMPTNTWNLTIGTSLQSGGQRFAGSLDEFVIWNRELNTSQITELYNNSGGVSCQNIIDSGAVLDDEYPIFGTILDNNNTFNDTGTAHLNVSWITHLNGTVGLAYNNVNVTPSCNGTYFCNYSFVETNGTYPYYWYSFGNGTNANYNQSATHSFNVGKTPDTDYPIFYNTSFTPPNASQVGSGELNVSVNINNTNGTAGWSFDNVNYSLFNSTGDYFNASNLSLGAGTYSYYFWAFGNGSDKLYNQSSIFSYTINVTPIDDEYPLFFNTSFTPPNASQVGQGQLNVSLNITHTNGTVGWSFDNVNYSLFNSTPLFYNASNLSIGAGTYSYYFWGYGNGSSANYNQSATFSYTINATQNVSIEHFDILVPEFLINSVSYVTIINDTFNLTNPKNIDIRGVGQLRKTINPVTTTMSMKLEFNGVTLFDEEIRSVSSLDDRGVFKIPIVRANGTLGSNNWTLSVKESSAGGINVSSLEIHLNTNKSNAGGDIISEIIDLDTTSNDTIFINIGNFSIVKSGLLNSSTLLDVQHTFKSSTSNTWAECYLQNNLTDEQTPTYKRWLENSGDVGSSGTNYLSQNKTKGTENWGLNCRSDKINEITHNVTTNLMEMQDSSGFSLISGFQNQTSGTTQQITGNNNSLITITDYVAQNETQLEIFASTYIQSDSGAQEGTDSPVIYFNSSNLAESSCFHQYSRSLESSDDVGTVSFYVSCKGLVVGNSYNFTLWADVSAGETLNVTNATLSAYESDLLNITQGDVPPIVSISNPVTNQNITTNLYSINWSTIDINGDSFLTNITISNGTNTTLIVGSLVDTIFNYTYNFSEQVNGFWNITVTSTENASTFLLSGNDTIQVIINITAVVDNEYPQFTNLIENPVNNTAYVLSANYSFNVTIININGTGGIEFNGINYSLSNISSIFNRTIGDLSAGTYGYYYWGYGNGTDENYNTTGFNYYTIAQATGVVNLTLNNTQGNANITQGDTIDINATIQTGDSGYITWYLDSTIYNNGTSPIFNATLFNSAGTFNISAHYEGSTNYTGDWETWWVNVSATADTTPPTFDEYPNNATLVYGIKYANDINATDETSMDGYFVNDTRFTMTRASGVLINNTALGVNLYWINISINDTSGNSNSAIIYINITQATGDIRTYLGGNRADQEEANNTEDYNFSTQRVGGEGNYTMLINGTLYAFGTGTWASNTSDLNYWGINVINITAILPTTQNYTSDIEFWDLNITEFAVSFNITIIIPLNFSNHTSSRVELKVNWSSGTPTAWWYNLNNSATNVSFTPNTTIIDLVNTTYTLKVFANNSGGDEASSTIVFFVILDRSDSAYFYLYVLVFIITSLLLVLSIYMEDIFIQILSGILFFALGLAIFTVGYPGLSNELLRKGIAFILWSLGAYLTVSGALNLIEENY